MATADVGYVAGHLGLDQSSLTALTTEPTIALVSTLLEAVAAKAHEFDNLYAEKLQTDIELENAIRGAEGRSQSAKATAESALKQAEEARQSLKEEETRRQAVDNELQILKSKTLDHDAEVKALDDRIETLQSSNRTSLTIIESHNKQDENMTEELTKLHKRNVDLAKEITSAKQSEQVARGSLQSAKYREDSLQQQLQLATRNGEWFEEELKKKNEEALKYRKDKGTRIAELQRENEDLRAQVDSLKRSEQQFRDRLQAMQAKAEDTLVKAQKQEAAAAGIIESYKQELEDQKRLVSMSEQLSQRHRERVRDLEAEKERLRGSNDNEVRRVRLELEEERRATSEFEEKVRQLESDLDEAHVRLEHAPVPGSTPQTPRANGSLAARAASPFGTPASIRSKSSITATQAIEQLYQVKGQLVSEKRQVQRLNEELDNMMSALEAKAPEIHDLQSEVEQLRQDMARMSELSQQSYDERDAARRAARKAKDALSTSQAEAKIAQTTQRDLTTQIQMLVFNLWAMEQGVERLTEEDKFRLQQLERGEITEDALADLSDTHQFITQKLTVFKDIKTLQAKNEDLMRITRQLADQIESEDALAAQHQAKEDHDKVEKLEQELAHMVDETKSVKNTMESFKMERDMFRRLLQQRTGGGDDASMMRSSLDGSQRLPLASIESGEHTESLSEALRKLQSDYDNFREVQEGVRKDFRDQVDRLTGEKNTLHTDKTRLQGELRLELERKEMLSNNYVALQSDNAELQKRAQLLSETAAKQDIRTQQVAEELVEARGLLSSMQNETANLKAEKTLWKNIQDRMRTDNENLIEEKNRLNNLLATQQALENERSLSESEARRKALTRNETLERDLNDTKKKLDKASQEIKELQLRKEYEAKESQKRVDDLMTSLGKIREDHVSVKTSRDHLQARVNELTVELRNAEERVGRLQPRPTPRSGPGAEAERSQQLESEIADLNNDIADLRRELDLTKTQLENAQTQAEQYRELSAGNEETLEDLRASQEVYRLEMESLIAEKEAQAKESSQRFEDVSSELSKTNAEMSLLRDTQGEVARRVEDEKAILQEEVNRLRLENAGNMEVAQFAREDLRAQTDITTKAQQDYEEELVKHAEAAKVAQKLRTEYNELKGHIQQLKAEAESARAALAQNESSWDDRRQQMEEEIAELKTRREEVNAQNKLLHQQLEGFTAQVSALQQSRHGDDGDEAMSPAPADGAIDGLRELNSYLRREKEILEVQYDLKLQESKRLQNQLDYRQQQLDEARLKLDQERSQSAQTDRSSVTHQNLMEKLNELNLYRESSMTLRNENNTLREQAGEQQEKVEQMQSKVQPLEREIDALKSHQTHLEDQLKQIQEDRDRWQKRTGDILTKYGRVDPEEMTSLKESVTTLEGERDALKAQAEPLTLKLSELEKTLQEERERWQTTRESLIEQAKARSKKLTGEKKEAVAVVQKELDEVRVELVTANERAQSGAQEKTSLEQQIQSFQQQVEQMRQQQQQTATEPASATPAPAAVENSGSSEVVAQLEQQLTNVRKELEAVHAQRLGAQTQLDTLRQELQVAVSERDAAIDQLKSADSEQTTGQTNSAAQPTAEAADSAMQDAPSALFASEKQALEEKLAAAEAQIAEAQKKAQELEEQQTQIISVRSEKMKAMLNTKLKTDRENLQKEYKQKADDLKLQLDQEKAIWQAENPGKLKITPPSAHQPPSTPAKAEPPATPISATVEPGMVPAELAKLDDAGVRQFLTTNSTVKSIFTANMKKKLESEKLSLTKDFEAKIAAARESTQLMESKKASLRINMGENKLRAANAKLEIVSTAATETPQKPVVEVWEVAKVAKPPPATAPAASVVSAPTPAQPTPSTPSAKAPAPAGTAQTPTPTAVAASLPAKPNATPQSVASTTAANKANPFATAGSETSAPNPFVDKAEAVAPTQQAPAPQPARTGIPMPRGGGRGRGGPYVAPGQRAASGTQENGQPPSARGGRGGRGGGRGGLSAAAADFQPGNKRPRGDSEVGAGAKRARGAH